MMNTQAEQKKGIRRTAIVLVIVALAFYFGFIMLGVIRS